MRKQINLKNKIREWAFNGVSIREMQERLGWLGEPMTEEEINKVLIENKLEDENGKAKRM